jgi:hypothetical protein
MHFINLANKSACVLLFLARALVLADMVVVVDEEGGVEVEVLLSVVATALAPFAGFPIYLVKQMGNLWPVLPQWLHTSCSWLPSFFV